MSNQANNEIQLNFTTEKSLEHLPTETNASEQATQELNAEQLEEIAGASAITHAPKNVILGSIKGAASGLVKGAASGAAKGAFKGAAKGILPF